MKNKLDFLSHACFYLLNIYTKKVFFIEI